MTAKSSSDQSQSPQQSSPPSDNSTALWHGLGLFGESYLLFSIGTLRPLWEALYPLCFSNEDADPATSCPHPYLTYNSLSYSVVLGVMLGMVIVGTLAGRIGRRNGSLLTASIMVAGAAALVLASLLLAGNFNNDDNNNNEESGRPDVLFMVMSAALFIFGIGVGGEYPLSASLASERAMSAMKERRRLEEQQERDKNRNRTNASSSLAATDLMSSRLLTTSMNDDGNNNGGVKGSSSNDHHSWQTTTSRTSNMAQIEQYNVTQQSQSSANNNNNNAIKSTSSKTMTRGREVIVVFSMQGMGILANSLILTFLLMLTKSKGQQQNDNNGDNNQQQQQGEDDYNNNSFKNQYHNQITLLYIWRIIYAIGLAILIYVLLSRIRHLNESEVWTQDRLRRDEEELERQQQRQQKQGAFYGNKLFQSTFLLALTGENATLTQISGASAINAFVALLGYYAAALIVDKPTIGRLRLQQTGFVITGTLFLICGFLSESLSSTTLVIIYLGSSFFGQCGPNCTTFLIPAEVFPTEMRTVCHGISASAGKLGALIASILFTFAKTDNALFLISGYTSFAAAIFTFLTIPDLTTLDLYEIDKQWRMILNGSDIEDGTPKEHSGSWHACISYSTETATDAVRKVLLDSKKRVFDGHYGGGFGKHIHALAEARDAKGRPALGLASKESREVIYEHLLFCGRYKLQIGPPEYRTATSVVLRAQDLAEQADYGVIFDKADDNGNGKLDRKELKAIASSIGLDPDLFLKDSGKSTTTILKEEFVAICKRQLGDGPREVVIKLMQSKDHWERECNARKDYELESKYVVSALPNIPSEDAIAKAVRDGEGGLDIIREKYLDNIELGIYAIVMDAGDRNLSQMFNQEQPTLDTMRDKLREVFKAVQHMHEKNLMHGDIKMVNIVRFRIDNKLRLIDLDASAEISAVEDSFAGAKFSSAILPPEMIKRIETKEELEEFDKYWVGIDDDLKVSPKPYEKHGVKGHYVVKSFRTEEGKPVEKGLPYTLVDASRSIDLWSLGVLAFTLLTGEPLVPSTRDDDCASGGAMHFLYSWGTRPEKLIELFNKIPDKAARDLISQLLQYEPTERKTIATLLEEHCFFNPPSGDLLDKLDKLTDIDANLKEAAKNRKDDRALLERMDANIEVIKKLGIESKAELRHTRHVLLKGIFEATEVDTPTTFIVLNDKLPEPPNEEMKKKILGIVTAEDGSGVSVTTEHAMRTVCHGISASAGKLGALIASILFTFAKTDNALFLISGYTSFAAAIFTFLTIPDLTTLDLYEIDKQWRMILNGSEYEYDGAAVNPRHLSYLEWRKKQ
ncbi:inorganic phosphate transporter [Skeletonema marinoi]|uniref:Inorganic phosphate transporter n=1 Tax=Skeletonema marinoi TaxID=267567 RepID=A0AAD9DDF7_9STRA|nr:inorganic phosphate transporter [Skeletonema marinoi]